MADMRSAQLPPVRVTPSVRRQIEAVLREGETLSQFIEQAAVQAAQRREQQLAFVERGRASLASARKSGEYCSAAEALAAMRERLDARTAELRRGTDLAKRGS